LGKNVSRETTRSRPSSRTNWGEGGKNNVESRARKDRGHAKQGGSLKKGGGGGGGRVSEEAVKGSKRLAPANFC